MSEVYSINQDDFDEVVLRSDVPALVEFSSVLCRQCSAMRPILDELAADLDCEGKVVVVEVTVNPQLAEVYKITGVPTLIVFKGGQPRNRMVGTQSKATLLAALAS